MKNTNKKEIKLPSHLQESIDNYEAKLKEFGLTEIASMDMDNVDDFHPIHAMIS